MKITWTYDRERDMVTWQATAQTASDILASRHWPSIPIKQSGPDFVLMICKLWAFKEMVRTREKHAEMTVDVK